MAIAREDGDSSIAPAIEARFSPRGPGSVFYSSDVSFPQGDTADWIGFTPYFDSVTVSLDCQSGTGLIGEIMTEGAAMAGAPPLECNSNHVLTVKAGNDYMLRLSISTPGDKALYVSYTVSIFALRAY